jgi:cold shock CspA family protein
MRDRILENDLQSFTKEFDLTTLPEPTAFEYFVNYCVISRYHPDAFDPEDVAVGGHGDLGLDGLAIIVNDRLVSSKEDVDYLTKEFRRLEVEFILVQAKTSAKFSGADIGTFLSGARSFFQKTLPSEANLRMFELHRIKEHIYGYTKHMETPPKCRLYYATTGTWIDDLSLRTRREQGVADLSQTNLFSSVDFRALDAEGLKHLYRELNKKITREIEFEKHTILPQIDGVQEAYIGIVPCRDYLGLICDDEGALNRRLFYDNVRDFQGHNPVNIEIEETIQDGTRSDRFALLNNGITIVAGDIIKVGAKFRLRDYQIVNGCQTSHIIYQNSEKLTPKVYVPLKLIVTNDLEVTNQIIQGTNRQTEVKLEAFESLRPFQKKLEEFYIAMGHGGPEALYYERRSKQYEHQDVSRSKIITLANQVKCFVAMFLNEPQSTHRYYGELLESYGHTRVFNDSHSAFPYYISGATLSALERHFGAGHLPRAWRALRYQLLMVFRLKNQIQELPPLNSKAIDGYCEGILTILNNPALSESAFRSAGELIESVQDNLSPWREPPERTRLFTSELITRATDGMAVGGTARTTWMEGTVKWFSEIRGYGFIVSEDGHEIFVHFSEISGSGYRNLVDSQRVRFVIKDTTRGPQAASVHVVPE